MISLITTTVNTPKVLASYARLDPEMLIIVAADRKTPPEAEEWVYENCQPKSRIRYLTPDMQRDLNYKSSELIGWDSDSRRNIALLEAVKAKAGIIVSLDDDMLPLGEDFFYTIERVLTTPFTGLQLGAHGEWFNHGEHTIPPTRARGLPIDARLRSHVTHACGVPVGALQGIILGVPDADAVTAIANEPIINSVTDVLRNGFVVDPNALTVMNSQITAFRAELAPCFAQFYKWQGRNTDIMASLIMRHVMRDMGLYTYFGPPCAYHARQKRPLLNDLRAEMYGLENIQRLQLNMDTMLYIPKNGTVVEKVRHIYEGLRSIWSEECFEATMAWCDDVESVL